MIKSGIVCWPRGGTAVHGNVCCASCGIDLYVELLKHSRFLHLQIFPGRHLQQSVRGVEPWLCRFQENQAFWQKTVSRRV